MESLRYGSETLELPPSLRGLARLAADEPAPLPDASAAVARALSRPLGSPALGAFVEPGDHVAIVVPDATRRAALEVLLPAVARVVREAGAARVVVRVANGTHRRSTAPELAAAAALAGAVAGDRSCDDPSAHEALGSTPFVERAAVDAEVARADRLVLLGAISFHYLAGFGGGSKLLAPGCADRATAIAIHRRCLAEAPGPAPGCAAERPPGRHPRARPGVLEGNPLREACDSLLPLAPPAFALHVALTRAGRIAAVFAGDVKEAHAAAARFHEKGHVAQVEAQLDLVVASAGGAPYDLDLYQAQKALQAACGVVRDGGAVVLCAGCTEGAGSTAFARAVALGSPDDVERALRERFEIALHTALALRRQTERVRCVLVSGGVPEELVRGLGMEPAATLADALAKVGGAARAALLPDGAHVLPRVRGAG